MSNPIDEALGLRPMEEIDPENSPTVVEETPAAVYEETDDETLRDLELARSNIQNIIQTGDDSLKEMIDLAKQSESPRAFEVAATLMKTLLEANKDFVEISSKKKEYKSEKNKSPDSAQTNVTNNNLILSTSDLLKMIKDGNS